MRRAAPWLLLLALLAACGGAAPTVAGEKKPAEDDYNAAVAALEDKSYPEAQKLFERIKTKYPYSKYAPLSELRLADLRFKEEKYPEAAEAYAQFVKMHPTHEEVDYAAFRVGLARYRDMPSDFFLFPATYERDMSAAEGARKGFDDFVAKYPKSKYAEEAKKKLDEVKGRFADREWYVASFYRKRERWPGVAVRLERLVKEYPGSPREPEALMGLAEAYLKMNERFRAQQALQQLLVRYPKDPHRAEAEKLLASLR
ncbi:MAG TPA: outer membrane protein assembly factor BamD [Anaeromyxobacteraceae bacterium]|nr:outer membrane protein assembly factor BamD [Anaeromyxobacteraceae bacterium]